MKTTPTLFIGSILAWLLFGLAPAMVRGDGPVQTQAGPGLSGCPMFPADNIWNTPVDTLPVDPNSAAYIANIGANTPLHADFGAGDWPPGSGAPVGIPYVVVPFTQTEVAITSFTYAAESDPGPYPIPPNAPIEGGPAGSGDRHVLVVRQGECKLYEIFNAFPNGDTTWRGDSGAVFDLTAHTLRPNTWTSADAAGLPILPGLARYEEVAAGEIRHALRFTVAQTRRAYVWPARHFAASSTDPNRPPMGQRFRLKASFVIDNSFSPQGQVILRALQKYGLILADNGSNWYISGAPHNNWDNDALHDDLGRVRGSDFEAVDVSSLIVNNNSGQAQLLTASPPVQAIPVGGVAHYTIALMANDNLSPALNLAAGNPSPSLTLDLSANSLAPAGQVTLAITDTHPAGSLPAGIVYTIALTATGGGVTQTTTVNLLVGGRWVYLPLLLK